MKTIDNVPSKQQLRSMSHQNKALGLVIALRPGFTQACGRGYLQTSYASQHGHDLNAIDCRITMFGDGWPKFA